MSIFKIIWDKIYKVYQVYHMLLVVFKDKHK